MAAGMLEMSKLSWAIALSLVALVLTSFVASKWAAQHSLAWAVLHDSSYVILLRHGDAPGRSEPEGFNLADCKTQRNLSDRGRGDSRHLGETLRINGVHVVKVISSRWCRTRETAELLKHGDVEDAPAFDNLEYNKSHADELLAAERRLITSWVGPGVLVIVTHSSNIQALTGVTPAESALVVLKPGEGQIRLLTKPLEISDVRPARWLGDGSTSLLQ
ncbi:MAG: hypothetical protein QOF09_3175 [Alphaproteobacteria bacterium]|nr:hypothetical protein [Alphaproteobacteria bacterium]